MGKSCRCNGLMGKVRSCFSHKLILPLKFANNISNTSGNSRDQTLPHCTKLSMRWGRDYLYCFGSPNKRNDFNTAANDSINFFLHELPAELLDIDVAMHNSISLASSAVGQGP